MVFFSAAFHILVISFAVAFAASIVIVVPLTIYIIPYSLWLGTQVTRGRYLSLKEDRFFRMVRNATALYMSWITHTAPVFK